MAFHAHNHQTTLGELVQDDRLRHDLMALAEYTKSNPDPFFSRSEGYLSKPDFKAPLQRLGRFHRRWFALEDHLLKYYKDETLVKQAGFIDVGLLVHLREHRGTAGAELGAAGHVPNHAMALEVSDGRIFVVAAQSRSQMLNWMLVLVDHRLGGQLELAALRKSGSSRGGMGRANSLRATPAPAGPGGVLVKGYLTKKSNMRKDMKKRYFALMEKPNEDIAGVGGGDAGAPGETLLVYWRTEQEFMRQTETKTSMDVSTVAPWTGKDFGMHVRSSDDRELWLGASNQSDFDMWMEGFQQAIATTTRASRSFSARPHARRASARESMRAADMLSAQSSQHLQAINRRLSEMSMQSPGGNEEESRSGPGAGRRDETLNLFEFDAQSFAANVFHSQDPHSSDAGARLDFELVHYVESNRDLMRQLIIEFDEMHRLRELSAMKRNKAAATIENELMDAQNATQEGGYRRPAVRIQLTTPNLTTLVTQVRKYGVSLERLEEEEMDMDA